MTARIDNNHVPIAFAGRLTKLRPVVPGDYPALFALRTDASSIHLWSQLRRLPSFDEFVSEIEQIIRGNLFLLLLDKQTEAPIGFYHTYDMSLNHGWAFWLMYLGPAYRARGHGGEAGLITADHLFRNFNLRKLYADVYEYNVTALRALRAAGYQEEGRLRQHVLYDGRYWDYVRLALYRDDWNRLREQFADLFLLQEDVYRLASREMSSQSQSSVTADKNTGRSPT